MPPTYDSRPSLDVEASVPKPRLTGTGIGIVAGLWVLYSLAIALVITQAEDAPFAGAWMGQLIEAGILAVGSIPVWLLVIRSMDGMHWGWILGAHLVVAPLYAWGTLELYLRVMALGAPAEVTTALETRYWWILVTHVTLYVIQFAIYHTVRSVKRLRLREQQAAELMARAREQELAALKAQINPHFLFNTLNSISATLRRDPEQAREMIAKLSRLMRYALDSSSTEQVPLRDELDFAERYLALERHRFSDRLETTIEVDADEAVLDMPVPPMLLQPLVENALRHGIAPSERGGTITVRVTTADDRVQIRVADTGVGPDSDAPLSADSDGMGLANTNDRLTRTFGPDAALRTAENDPSGFVVRFSLPANGTR